MEEEEDEEVEEKEGEEEKEEEGGGEEEAEEECSSSAHSNTVHSSRQTAEKKVTIKPNSHSGLYMTERPLGSFLLAQSGFFHMLHRLRRVFHTEPHQHRGVKNDTDTEE